MKRYKIISQLLVLAIFAGCSSTMNDGELRGGSAPASYGGSFVEATPPGMQYIKHGALRVGSSDEDPMFMIEPSKTVSIEAFWMDDTEITNNEYRQFTNWVRDSIAKKLIVQAAGFPPDTSGLEYRNDCAIDHGIYKDDYNAPLEKGDYIKLNWNTRVDYSDTSLLDALWIPVQERFFNKRKVDARKLTYTYYWIDYKKAASVSRTYNYNSGIYEKLPQGSEQDRRAFINKEMTPVYPDTLCWIRDFTYSYNEPWTEKYFWHVGFDNYPVVGVTWEQAKAFCHWRTKQENDRLAYNGQPTVMKYRLPTEWEWEWAARGNLKNSKYPWGGYYPRDQQGIYLANFKPIRGNYSIDGHMYTRSVNANYQANDFGLYDMAGNVAEWTISAYDELSIALQNDLNPNFQYNAKPNDPPALKRKVVRGGSWKDISHFIQSATRDYEYQDSTKSFIGFRCVRSAIQLRNNP